MPATHSWTTPDAGPHGALPTIEARALSKSFSTGAQRVDVLREVSVSVLPGELTLVAGPSGCGKSTLLALLSGLQAPDGGSVVACGEDLSTLSRRERERFRLKTSAFVFQNFNLFPALTSLEQVQLALSCMGIDRAESARRAQEALEEVGMGHRLRMRPAELSGGEKQRVAIARALAKQPRLLFADEPTSALDAASGQVVIDLLHRIARAHGSTVLCVSHDPRLLRHADRVIEMEDGSLLADRRLTPPPSPAASACAHPSAVSTAVSAAVSAALPVTPATPAISNP
ncbi:ABC transporter ATP-binding protein [Roseateles sp.]|uniref:ABC transporter ATP-binding protein n=1 Tax=Roseateles sp. TaxID=1971397 RepID=UPI0031D4B6DB